MVDVNHDGHQNLSYNRQNWFFFAVFVACMCTKRMNNNNKKKTTAPVIVNAVCRVFAMRVIFRTVKVPSLTFILV